MNLEATIPVELEPFTAGTTRDAYGNSIDGWGEREQRLVYCWWDPDSTEPGMFGRDSVDADKVILAPWTCDPRDRIWIDGNVFEITGSPHDWNHGPFGWQPGYQINLKAVTG